MPSKRHQIKPPKPPTKEEVELNKERNINIIKLWKQGLNWRQISEKTGLSKGVIRGVIDRTKGNRARLKPVRREKTMPCGYFDLKKLRALRKCK